jgi:hypothetical protein
MAEKIVPNINRLAKVREAGGAETPQEAKRWLVVRWTMDRHE